MLPAPHRTLFQLPVDDLELPPTVLERGRGLVEMAELDVKDQVIVVAPAGDASERARGHRGGGDPVDAVGIRVPIAGDNLPSISLPAVFRLKKESIESRTRQGQRRVDHERHLDELTGRIAVVDVESWAIKQDLTV